jgi:hypothetical protein
MSFSETLGLWGSFTSVFCRGTTVLETGTKLSSLWSPPVPRTPETSGPPPPLTASPEVADPSRMETARGFPNSSKCFSSALLFICFNIRVTISLFSAGTIEWFSYNTTWIWSKETEAGCLQTSRKVPQFRKFQKSHI